MYSSLIACQESKVQYSFLDNSILENEGITLRRRTGISLSRNTAFYPVNKILSYTTAKVSKLFYILYNTQYNIIWVDGTATYSTVFLNRRAVARYRALASIIPGRERPEETTICYKFN